MPAKPTPPPPHPFGSHSHRFASFRVQGLSADGPPTRRLRVHVTLENRSATAGVLLSAWAEAAFDPGGVAAYGALFYQQHPLAHPAILPPRGSTSGEFVIPVSAEILDAVEQHRTDGVTLAITGQLVVAPVLQQRKIARGSSPASGTPEGPLLLGVPVTTLGTGDYDSAMVNHRIARSEWTQLINRWRWSDIELFELALSPRSGSVESTQAYTMLRQAERSFRECDFRGTLTHCRAGLEAFAKATGDGDVKRGYEAAITAKVGGEGMREDLSTLLHSLNDFAHAGRHARFPDEQ